MNAWKRWEHWFYRVRGTRVGKDSRRSSAQSNQVFWQMRRDASCDSVIFLASLHFVLTDNSPKRQFQERG